MNWIICMSFIHVSDEFVFINQLHWHLSLYSYHRYAAYNIRSELNIYPNEYLTCECLWAYPRNHEHQRVSRNGENKKNLKKFHQYWTLWLECESNVSGPKYLHSPYKPNPWDQSNWLHWRVEARNCKQFHCSSAELLTVPLWYNTHYSWFIIQSIILANREYWKCFEHTKLPLTSYVSENEHRARLVREMICKSLIRNNFHRWMQTAV